jgi:hypothetical protein
VSGRPSRKPNCKRQYSYVLPLLPEDIPPLPEAIEALKTIIGDRPQWHYLKGTICLIKEIERGLPKPLESMRKILHQGLEATAALWPDLGRAFD